MLLQAILLGLVAMLGNAEYLFGTSLLSRPLVMGTLTGIVLGDVQTGVTLGATLELAFMGAFSIRINCRFTSCFTSINRKERWNGIHLTSVCSQSR